MEIKVDLKLNQLIRLIRQLPKDQKIMIKREVEQQLEDKSLSEHGDELTNLLMTGPVMNKEEELNFKKFNNEFDKWTKNLSA